MLRISGILIYLAGFTCWLMAMTGCGGGGGDGAPAPGSDAYVQYPVYKQYPAYHTHPAYDQHWAYDYSYDPPPRVAPRAPAVYRAQSDWLSWQIDEYQRTWDGYFEELHVDVGRGYSFIESTSHLFASRNVLRLEREDHIGITLASDLGEASFITYGLRGIFGDEQLISIEVFGSGNFGSWPERGMYIGVRQFNASRSSWYGPFLPGHPALIYIQQNLLRGLSQDAYITIVVFDGDMLALDGLGVNVGRAP
ncbi:hypothetical protein IIA79_00485 [bacterium]|nr:hypothetical protein [bacterium]